MKAHMTTKSKKAILPDDSPLYQGQPFGAQVGDKAYTIRLQQEGEGPDSTLLEEPFLSIDTETLPIVGGEPLVPAIMQVCYPSRRQVVIVPA